jgi:hypothetical protein
LTNNLPLDNGLFKADYVIGARHRNILNHVDFATPSTTGSSGTRLSGINGTSSFGCRCSTPDSGNPVLGSGGPRHIQFGLKLIY